MNSLGEVGPTGPTFTFTPQDGIETRESFGEVDSLRFGSSLRFGLSLHLLFGCINVRKLQKTQKKILQKKIFEF